ncbi:MAG: sodium-dependent transporter [Solobacterium sp.]|nr:sodium-dependent transporter [Solobacterium sp.]
MNKKRETFSGKLGFVLSAAGASVGLGNIWRFPYLAARYGGGIFLLVYVLLAVTFGYTMIISETALGRLTGRSPVGAFRHFGNSMKLKTGGWINAVIPILIVPYYSVIGGWVCKYLFEYIRGSSVLLARDSYFPSFLSDSTSGIVWFVFFAVCTVGVIALGVDKGIERISRTLMPVLVVLSVITAVYSVSRPGAMAGVRYFLVPDVSRFSWMTVVAALGQMFYSLSCAMGILITFGSYMKKDVDIEASAVQVEIFDTAIAVLAGLMIIPAVFSYSGGDPAVLLSGPSLMFVILPKVFHSMGFGTVIGIIFFLLVFFAALTSAIALSESAASTLEDELKWNRPQAACFLFVSTVLLGLLSCLGFNVLDNIKIAGLGILDFFDFLTNSVMMPIAAVTICVLILNVCGTDRITEEVMISSEFRRKDVYLVVLRYLAVLFILVILISSVANVMGIISI